MRMLCATKAATRSTLKPAPAGILQRQCARGQHAHGEECEQCKLKRATLRRKASGASDIALELYLYLASNAF